MNKKLIIAIFMGLLASAASLVACLFMLQELEKTSSLRTDVQNLHTTVQNINTEVDLGDVNTKIADVTSSVQTIASDVEELQVNQQKILESVNGIESTTNTNDKPSTPTQPTEPKVEDTNDPIITESNGKLSSKTRLNFRKNPSLKSGVNRTLNSGEKVTVIGPEKQADGYTWVRVTDSKGVTGWIAKKYTN